MNVFGDEGKSRRPMNGFCVGSKDSWPQLQEHINQGDPFDLQLVYHALCSRTRLHTSIYWRHETLDCHLCGIKTSFNFHCTSRLVYVPPRIERLEESPTPTYREVRARWATNIHDLTQLSCSNQSCAESGFSAGEFAGGKFEPWVKAASVKCLEPKSRTF